MIMSEISLERIFELCKDINRENVIKLLLRIKKLYEARVEIKKILSLIIEKTDLFEEEGGILDLIEYNMDKKVLTK